MTIKTVLAPTDFSPASEYAVNYAVALARRLGAQMALVHVVPPFAATFGIDDRARWKMENDLRQQALEKLGAVLAPEDEDDLDLRLVVKSGDAAAGIASAAHEEHADIVVLGIHDRGFLGRLIMGSTVERLLRTSGIPVLSVCRPKKPAAFNRILVATDLSDTANRGFAYALDLAEKLHAELRVVHVHEDLPFILPEGAVEAQPRELAIEEARRRFSTLLEAGQFRKVNVRTVLVQGAAAPQILRTVEDVDADLLLITVENRGPVERALFGATAERLVRESPVPVLSIPGELAGRSEKVKEARPGRREDGCLVEQERVVRHRQPMGAVPSELETSIPPETIHRLSNRVDRRSGA